MIKIPDDWTKGRGSHLQNSEEEKFSELNAMQSHAFTQENHRSLLGNQLSILEIKVGL